MDIHEYQAKKILSDAGYTIKNGRLHYPEGVTEKH